jgi:hypothetical protein
MHASHLSDAPELKVFAGQISVSVRASLTLYPDLAVKQ